MREREQEAWETPSLLATAEDEAGITAFINQTLPESSTGLNSALPGVYAELRELAAAYLHKERPNHTLQPTALVHESYLRLVSQRTVDWSNRLHFLSIASRMMRRILANYAIARKRVKRDSGEPLLELDGAIEFQDRTQLSIAKVDEVLRELEALDPRQARVVELRFFGGLTIEETAEVLGVSSVTVKRDWMTARQWLQREIGSGI